MSDLDNQSEDVASLFRKFGGDPHAYREFGDFVQPNAALARASTQGASPWALVPGSAGRAPMPGEADAGLGVEKAKEPKARSAAFVPSAPTQRASPTLGQDTRASEASSRPASPLSVSALWPPRPQASRVQVAEAPAGAPLASEGTHSLDLLFARWAGTTAPPVHASSGHGLLARWRSQG